MASENWRVWILRVSINLGGGRRPRKNIERILKLIEKPDTEEQLLRVLMNWEIHLPIK